MISGILLVDKPKGWTSFDVVAKVRSIVRAQIRSQNPNTSAKIKVGHTGTLDPSATGLLIICIGKSTKQVPDLIKKDKTYQVELTLGSTSTTGDQEGDITMVKGAEKPSKSQVISVLKKFVGEQWQTPPIYSAIKIKGKKAYELARKGQEVKLEPRRVTVYSISEVNYQWPKITLVCRVSSGTYIRSLAVDIGVALSTGAYMSQLRRSAVGEFQIDNAIRIDCLEYKSIEGNLLR